MAHQLAMQYNLQGFAKLLRVRVSFGDTNCHVGPYPSMYLWAGRADNGLLIQDGHRGSLL